MKVKVNGIEYRSGKEFFEKENISAYKVKPLMQKGLSKVASMELLLKEKKVREIQTQEAFDAFDKAFPASTTGKKTPWTDVQKSILEKMVAENATIEEMVFATRRSRQSVLYYITQHNLRGDKQFEGKALWNVIRQKNPKTYQDILDLVSYTGANITTILDLSKKLCNYGPSRKYEERISFLAAKKVPVKEIAAKLDTSVGNVKHTAWVCNIELPKERASR